MNNNLSVSAVFGSAWKIFTDNISYVYYLLVPSFAFSLLALFVSPETYMYQPGSEVEISRSLPFFLLSIIGGIAAIFATISILFFVRRGKKQVWADWKSYVRLLPKYIGVCILQGLMILGGLILFIIPGIYLALRYAFVSYRTLEHPTESIKNLFSAEAKATEGNRFTIFCIGLVLLAILIAYSIVSDTLFATTLGTEGNMFADFVFEFLVTPFFTLVSIVTYTKLTNNKEEAPIEEKAEEPQSEKKEEIIEKTPAPEPETTPAAEPVV